MSKKGELFSNSEFDFHRVEIEFEKNDSENKRIEPVISSFKVGLLYECFLDALRCAGEDILDAYLDSEKPFSCSIRCKNENEKTVFFSGLDPIFSGFQRQKFKGSCPKNSQTIDYNKFIETTTRSKNSLLSHILEDRRLFIFLDSDQKLPDSISNFLSAEVQLKCTPAALENAVKKYIANDYQLDDDLSQKLMKVPLDKLMTIFSKGRPTFASHNLALAWLEEQKSSETTVKKSNASEPTLDDLHGLGAAGVWGRDLAQDLADWQQGKISWSDVDRGILLYGAPGTGKTTFAGALARTCGVNFIATSMSQWQAKGHLGDYLKAMRSSFEEARENAPCILFIDEFDSAGDRNAPSDSSDYIARAVNGLLECLDGEAKREGVVIVGATNYPNKIDEALRRPGRLDKTVEIPLPDANARISILKFHLNGLLTDQDFSEISDELDGVSGADIEQLVRQAKRFSRRQKRELQLADLFDALPPKRILSRKTFERLAVHEAGHAVVGNEHGYPIVEIKISKSVPVNVDNFVGGFVQFGSHQADFMSVVKDINEYTQRLLGGMAAEKVIFGEHSTGVASDLQHATYHVASMLVAGGMGDDLLCLSDMTRDDVLSTLRQRKDLQDKVSATLNDCLKSAETIIQKRRNHVEKLAAALMQKNRLSGAEVKEILASNERVYHEYDSIIEQQNNVRYLH